MLEWGQRRIELFPDKEEKSQRSYAVNDELLIKALRVHWGDTPFTEVEAAIRDNFDQFFYYLERFEYYIEAGLITTDDVRPYLIYWIEILAGKNQSKNPQFAKTVATYLTSYNFPAVIKIMRQFGYDVFSEPKK